MAEDFFDKFQDSYFRFKQRMGTIFGSVCKDRQNGRCVCMTCDDCGRIITTSSGLTIAQGEQIKKRCEGCAARVAEELLSRSPHSRKCSSCQAFFSVPAKVAALPPEVVINCQRCSDTHRQLVRDGSYLEVTLCKGDPRRGDSRVHIRCPKYLTSEIRKCMQFNTQGYAAFSEN